MKKVLIILVLFFLNIFISSCDSHVNVNTIEVSFITIESDSFTKYDPDVDGPGEPMRMYKGTYIDALNHAVIWGYNSLLILVPEKQTTEVRYMAKITENLFYEKFDAQIEDNVIEVELMSRKIPSSNTGQNVTYDILTDVMGTCSISLKIESVSYSTIQFNNIPENYDVNKLLFYVKNNVRRTSE